MKGFSVEQTGLSFCKVNKVKKKNTLRIHTSVSSTNRLSQELHKTEHKNHMHSEVLVDCEECYVVACGKIKPINGFTCMT